MNKPFPNWKCYKKRKKGDVLFLLPHSGDKCIERIQNITRVLIGREKRENNK